MLTLAQANEPLKLDPTPHYPHIVLALNLLKGPGTRFHWLIFVPDPGQGDDKAQTGIKLHATELDPVSDGITLRIWQFEATAFTLATSASVVAAAIIGNLTEDRTVQQLVDLLHKIPTITVPDADIEREPEFTCRVWVREALRRMHIARLIHCRNVDAMEAELLGHGLLAADAVKNGTFKMAELVPAVHSRTPTDLDELQFV